MLTVGVRDGIDYVYSKVPPFPELAKHCHVACPVMAESMIVTDQQLMHPKPAAQYVINKFLGGVRGKRVRERDYREVVNSRFRNHLQFFVE
jgi:hypothetical protein